MSHDSATATRVSRATWNYTLAAMWDYAGIGVDLQQNSFFAAWGGDAHLGASQAGIWGARIQ